MLKEQKSSIEQFLILHSYVADDIVYVNTRHILVIRKGSGGGSAIDLSDGSIVGVKEEPIEIAATIANMSYRTN